MRMSTNGSNRLNRSIRIPLLSRIVAMALVFPVGFLFWIFYAWADTPGTWTATGSMASARTGHVATLLSDGKVLITGGSDPAEIFDPAAGGGVGAFTATGSMVTVRGGHTATLLSDGKVLIAGGYNGSTFLASAELFDPAANGGTGAFTPTGSLTTVRADHTATRLFGGKVLITGGSDGLTELYTAMVYDPATGLFANTQAMNTARIYHTATLLPTGKVLIAGGRNGPNSLASAELFDPAANGGLGGFITTGSMGTGRQMHTATLLPSGQVLVAGGWDTVYNHVLASGELFVPWANGGAGAFIPTGSMGTGRDAHTAALLPNGKVLIAGGLHDSIGFLDSAELFDPAANGGAGAFTATGSMIAARAYHTATVLSNGEVLATGGYNAFGSLAMAELYTPEIPQTMEFACSGINKQVTNFAGDQYDPAVSEGRIAYTDTQSGNPDIWVYDIAANTYTRVTSSTDIENLADIDGPNVVYTDFVSLAPNPGFQTDIYSYNILTGVRSLVVGAVGDQLDPAISGNLVIWEDFQSGTGRVWVGDVFGSFEQLIYSPPDGLGQYAPAISGTLIAWQGQNEDIFAYDLATNTLYNVDVGLDRARDPAVSGNTVVYTSSVGASSDSNIFAYDVTTGVTTQLTTDPSAQSHPKISGTKVVWEDERNGNTDLYGYDLAVGGTDYPVIVDPLSRQFLQAFDGAVLAYTDDRGRFDGSGNGLDISVCSEQPSITSIAVTPLNPAIPVGQTQQFTATGTFSDATTQDITSSVSWSSSNTAAATISNTGLATGLSAGTTTIAAISGSISGSTTLTVNLQTYTLTLTTSGTGSGTTSGGGTYNSGQTVAVSATANNGSTFSGWTGPDATECTGGSVQMDADKSCTANFTKNGQSDLVMTAVTPNAATVNAGSTLSVTDTVANLGGASAGSFRIAYHLSTDTIYGNGDDVAISTIRVVTNPFAAGATSTATTTLTLPTTATAGVYYLCAFGDSLNQVPEADENNNILCSALQVTVPPPDLIISAISTSATTVTKGTKFYLSFKITNQGGSNAGAFVTDFHLSTDANYGGGDDTPISQMLSLPSLGTGASFSKLFSLVVPSTTPSGTYYVCGMTDVNNTVAESDEGNNTNCTGTTITVP